MGDQEKLAGLAVIAENITGLPVAEQFRILGKAGLNYRILIGKTVRHIRVWSITYQPRKTDRGLVNRIVCSRFVFYSC